MAGGRARRVGRNPRAAVACVLAAAALAMVGCGSSSHANDPRPAEPTRVSVTVTNHGVLVQPTRIAFGPERNQQIPQNQNHPQPPIKTKPKRPLDVVFVIANQTERDATVQVLHGSQELRAGKALAHSPETIEAELPTGSYTVSATGATTAGHVEVGPYRASSQNDILQP
jgi:hypothetical protein